MSIRNILSGFLLSFLAACSTPPVLISRPTVEMLRISYPPSLTPLVGLFQDCALNFPATAIFLEAIPSNQLDFKAYEIAMWFGDSPPPGLSAFYLGQALIEVVVHPDNPVEVLGENDLRDLFSGTIDSWEDAGGDPQPVTVWIYPPENEIQRLFTGSFMQGVEFSPFAMIAPDPAAMIETVSDDPGAIGLLPSLWSNGELKRVGMENSVAAPILAITTKGPEGVAREFLACVQSKREVSNESGAVAP